MCEHRFQLIAQSLLACLTGNLCSKIFFPLLPKVLYVCESVRTVCGQVALCSETRLSFTMSRVSLTNECRPLLLLGCFLCNAQVAPVTPRSHSISCLRASSNFERCFTTRSSSSSSKRNASYISPRYEKFLRRIFLGVHPRQPPLQPILGLVVGATCTTNSALSAQ